jgi:hypothetical protein
MPKLMLELETLERDSRPPKTRETATTKVRKELLACVLSLFY